jgi:transcriptional regulator GlxA family with amidase domain
MLEDPARSVEQIALLLDFSSAASLRNMLKRYTGLSPREVRENGGLRCVLHAFRQTLSPPSRSAASA